MKIFSRKKDKNPLIAAVDLGTNSFHMVIANVDSRNNLRMVSRDKEMVRLGESISGGDMKYLSQEAITRGVDAMRRFATMARKENALIRAIATSAVREAVNRDEFVKAVEKETGVHIEVVSGIEEGRLIYIGVIHAVPVLDSRTLVIDIGGGSTETALGQGGHLIYVHSAKLGAIRLTKKFFTDETITGEQISACREYIRGDWAPVFRALLAHGFETVVGSSGTIQTLAAIALAKQGKSLPDLINGTTIKRDDMLAAIEAVLTARTPAERAALPGMDSKRADIIPAGALIIEQAVLGLNIQKIIISGYALREGVVFDTVQKRRDMQEFHHLSHLRYESIYSMAETYKADKKHSEHVKNLALKIFDELRALHSLGDTERELLEAAALLHDVGYHISPDQHHKHSYYLIRNAVLPGFTNDEAEIIANIARYHRKSHPKKKHENFQRLTPELQNLVKILSGILRIAEGLDRRLAQTVQVQAVRAKNTTLEFHLGCERDFIPDIELWGAKRRKDLLEEVFQKKINFNLGDA